MINDSSVGGQFSFTPGEVYEFYIEEDDSFGKAYIVVKNRLEIGFDENQFKEAFEII